MATAPLANASAASRMSEEAVDLICSFVRDMDGPDSTRTLCALMLTSRQFVSSATCALLFDPTKHTSSWFEFCTCVRYLIKKRPLGRHVRRLDDLAYLLHGGHATFDHELAPEIDIIMMSFLRCCPGITSVTLNPIADAQWPEELARLSKLTEIKFVCTDEGGGDQAVDVLVALESPLPPTITTLTLESFVWHESAFGVTEPVALSVTDFALKECDECEAEDWSDFPLTFTQLRRLHLQLFERPTRLPTSLLPETLETLTLEPLNINADQNRSGADCSIHGRWEVPEEWEQLSLPNLRSLKLPYAWLTARGLRVLISSSPHVNDLLLPHATWHSCEWRHSEMDDVKLLAHLSSLRSLHQVDLGYLPGPYLGDWRLIPRTRQYCRDNCIQLTYSRLAKLQESLKKE